jgi:hypothetical protein
MHAPVSTVPLHDTEGNPRRCRQCGQPGPYRNTSAAHCIPCDQAQRRRRDEYIRMYHMARSRATANLIARHRDEFNELLEERREELSPWPQDDLEIPILYHPSTPEEAMGRAKEAGEARKRRMAERAEREERRAAARAALDAQMGSEPD